MITSNNIVDELIRWLEKHGVDTSKPLRLEDIEYNLLLMFAKEKGLLKISPEVVADPGDPLDDLASLPEEVEQQFKATKPKKIRQKK